MEEQKGGESQLEENAMEMVTQPNTGKSEPSLETFPLVTKLNALVLDIDSSATHNKKKGVVESIVKTRTVTLVPEQGEEDKCVSPKKASSNVSLSQKENKEPPYWENKKIIIQDPK